MQLDVDIEPIFKICTYEIHTQTNGHAKITKAYTSELGAVSLIFTKNVNLATIFFSESVVNIFRLLPYAPTILWPSIISPPMICPEI